MSKWIKLKDGSYVDIDECYKIEVVAVCTSARSEFFMIRLNFKTNNILDVGDFSNKEEAQKILNAMFTYTAGFFNSKHGSIL